MSNNESSAFGWIFKSGIFLAIAGALYYFFNLGTVPQSSDTGSTPDSKPNTEQPDATPNDDNYVIADKGLEEYLPTDAGGELVRHKYFSLSYNEDHEQANWVLYRITRERLNNARIERTNQFLPDPMVRTESATSRDYNGSGYDRGHLCPAADMAFDSLAMLESFYMSNMSPQVQEFNGGIWRELEELTRDWGRRYEKLIVVTGPVLRDGAQKTIGFSKVSVPKRYYRVILTKERAIGFILPNAVSDKQIMDFACSVDDVERATGIDFFPKVLSGQYEALEAQYNRTDWPVNQERYQRRVVEWNAH
jgi:endonuclease G, mitochondrial